MLSLSAGLRVLLLTSSVVLPCPALPAGVRPSEDGAEVASPVSIMEWFMSFYEHKGSVGCAPLECTLRQGELLFVPVRERGPGGASLHGGILPAWLSLPGGCAGV